MLAFSENIKWQPKPSLPTPEAFVRECTTSLKDFDIMGMRGEYHKDRVAELVTHFAVWRRERLPGVRAFQSTYDRYASQPEYGSFSRVDLGPGLVSQYANGSIGLSMTYTRYRPLITFSR